MINKSFSTLCVCVCVHVCGCVGVFESLPVKEGGRERVHCTLSQWKQDQWFLSLIFFFRGACLCVIYYTEYYQAELLASFPGAAPPPRLGTRLAELPDTKLYGYCVSMNLTECCYFLLKFTALFAGYQGSSHSYHRTNTGFSSFKLPTCGLLQKGRSHSHTIRI